MAPQRHQVGLPPTIYKLLAHLRDELTDRTGQQFSIVDTIARAATCLRDAHRGDAWLSPREAAPVYEQRHQDSLAAAIMQTAAACGRVVRGLDFNTSRNRIEIVFADDDDGPPVTFPVGALQRHADN